MGYSFSPSSPKSVRVGILGAGDIKVSNLIRLLVQHPFTEIVLLTGEKTAGQPVPSAFPNLALEALPDFMHLDEVEWPAIDLDVVFTSLPHLTSQSIIKGLCHAVEHNFLEELVAEGPDDLAAQAPSGMRIIDLSSDFRLQDLDQYSHWFGRDHSAPQLQKKAIYGLCEFGRDAIREASLVAIPGSVASAALLALKPLIATELIREGEIIIDAKLSPPEGQLSGYPESFKVSAHTASGLIGRHPDLPEIEQEIELISSHDYKIGLSAFYGEFSRGEILSIYVTPAHDKSATDIRTALEKTYMHEPFVHILPDGQFPIHQMVSASNHCMLNVFTDERTGRVIIVTALDSFVKGGAGLAIQNMNIMLGMEETMGLEQLGMYP